MPILRAATLLALAVAATPARSDAVDQPAPVAAPTGCELHIWPSSGLESLTEGFLNQTRNQALRDKAGNPIAIAGALDPPAQLDAIAALDLPALLKLPGARLVPHAGPPPAGQDALAAAAAPAQDCRAELVIRHVVLARTAIAGAALQGSLRFRLVAGAGAAPRSFAAIASAALTPDPSLPTADSARAVAELRDAFKRVVTSFAGYATAPPKPPRRPPA